MKKIITLLIAIFFLGSASLFAEITVLKVKGNAAYKTGKDWTQLKAGQTIPEGAKISTGANSSVELKLNALNHTITIKPFTVIQVYSKTTDKQSDTNVGLKRGNIVVKVPKDKKVKTVFKVTTPIATSSVRGTAEDIFYGPDSGMIVKVLEGEIEGANRLNRRNFISGKQVFHQLPGQSGAGFILGSLRGGSIINVSGSGTTGDEQSTGLYNNDQTGNPEGDAGLAENSMNAMTKVIITIGW